MTQAAKQPKYPSFRTVDLKSSDTLATYTKRFSKYSDISFLSLYSWNTDNKTRYSFLNGNLVIKMSDYNELEKKNCILLGTNKPKQTLELLFRKRNKLVLLPEEIVNKLKKAQENDYDIKEDFDNFDYVYATESLANLNGKKYKSTRQNVNCFKASYRTEHRIIDIVDPLTKKQILLNISKWKETKEKNYNKKEISAIKRVFKYTVHGNFLNVGVFEEKKLIGFTINEIINRNMAIGHFGKYDPSYKGISKYLEHITAYYLLKKGIKLLNLEQDLGIEGIRSAKKSLRPTDMIKKYTMTKIL